MVDVCNPQPLFNFNPIKVDEDHYFMMGDNRHDSEDSRFWGFVPEDHLLGKAVNVWFSLEPDKSILEGLRKERIFSTIK